MPFALQQATVLPPTSAQATRFLMLDDDLVVVQMDGTPSGFVEIHIFEASSYVRTRVDKVTPIPFNKSVLQQYAMRGDDLVLIQQNGTASNMTEIHIVSASSDYEKYVLNTPTCLGVTGAAWTFLMRGDDLVAINRQGSGGRVDVHVLSASSDYKQVVLNASTPLLTAHGPWQFVMQDDDIVAVKQVGASGKTEVHILSADSDYNDFSHHASTDLHVTDAGWSFAMHDDGLACIHFQGTGLAAVEVHVVTIPGEKGFFEAVADAFVAVVEFVIDAVTTVIDAVVTTVESVVGPVLAWLENVVVIFEMIPVIGPAIQWSVGLFTRGVHRILSLPEGIATAIGLPLPAKKLRLVVIVPTLGAGRELAPRARIHAHIQFVIDCYWEQAKVRVIPAKAFHYTSAFDKGRALASDDYISVVPVSSEQAARLAGLRSNGGAWVSDLGPVGTTIRELILASNYFAKFRRLTGFGAPLYAIAVTSIDGRAGHSMGEFNDYVLVDFRKHASVLAHEMCHASGFWGHASGTTTLMTEVGPYPPIMSKWEIWSLRGSTYCSGI